MLLIRNDRKPYISSQMSLLIDKRNFLLSRSQRNDDLFIKKQIQILEEDISKIQSQENWSQIKQIFSTFADHPDKVNINAMWKALSKFNKFDQCPPIAKIGHNGELVTNAFNLKELLSKEYKDRLRTRKTRPDMQDLRSRRKDIFEKCLQVSKSNKINDFSDSDVKIALSNLKNNKSRDPDGFINVNIQKRNNWV